MTVLGQVLFPYNYNNAVDLAPAYILFVIALYVFMEKEIKISNNVVKRIISFMAKHSFSVYMVHWNVRSYITPKIVHEPSDMVSFLLNVMITLLSSVFLAVVFDVLIINPVQKLMNRVVIN